MKIDKRPKKDMWAPGEYFCRCFDCYEEFMGDKRSMQCADCAYEEDYLKPPEKIIVDIDRWYHNAYDRRQEFHENFKKLLDAALLVLKENEELKKNV